MVICQFVDDEFFAVGWGKLLWNSRINIFITITHYKIRKPPISNLCLDFSSYILQLFFSTNEYISEYGGVHDYFHWLFNIFSMTIRFNIHNDFFKKERPCSTSTLIHIKHILNHKSLQRMVFWFLLHLLGHRFCRQS